MSSIWFTSDLHIGHLMVAGSRGFDSTEIHDDLLALRWDERIRPDDQVWVLGDVVGRRGDEPHGLEWIAQRPGIKHLISGNHDACHPLHSGAHKAQRQYLEVFESVQQSGIRKIAGHKVLLSHFPYGSGPFADHTPLVRYPEWRFPNFGRWLLHGHTHTQEQRHGRQLHVGVDAHQLAPVSLHWVERRIEEGPADE